VLRAALIQLNVSDDPSANLPLTESLIREAAGQGAGLVLTPENTNCLSQDRAWQEQVLRHERDDPTLAALRALARELSVWLLIGSLGVKTDSPDGRFANRSFMLSPEGGVVARYDKIHMFDVQLSPRETFRESAAYRPGARAVLARTAPADVGMTICYDLRFPRLFRRLARSGAQIIAVPAAFSPLTGEAHWHVLLRARAIETGCFVLAPAQSGEHPISHGTPRRTYGHSLAVNPWGEVLADAGEGPGVTLVDLDLAEVRRARRRLPVLEHERDFEGPR